MKHARSKTENMNVLMPGMLVHAPELFRPLVPILVSLRTAIRSGGGMGLGRLVRVRSGPAVRWFGWRSALGLGSVWGSGKEPGPKLGVKALVFRLSAWVVLSVQGTAQQKMIVQMPEMTAARNSNSGTRTSEGKRFKTMSRNARSESG